MRNVTTSKTLAIVLLVAACGSSSSSDDASKFVGVWTFDSGTITATCSGGLPGGSFPLTGLTGTITRTDNTHIRLTANASCVIDFTVSGSTAMVVTSPPQSCTLNTPTLGPQQIAINMWTMTLTGTTMSATISGTALAGVCTASGSGSLSQHGGTDGGASDASSG